MLNLRHLIELVEKCCAEEELRLDLENERVIVVDYKSAKEATPLILEHHGIGRPCPMNLRKKPVN